MNQQFAFIASIVRSIPVDACNSRETTAHHFAEEIAKTNKNFDRKRFLLACGVNG